MLVLGFKQLASLAILVIGFLSYYLLGSPISAFGCLALAVFLSKDKIQSLFSSTKPGKSTSSNSNKKNTPKAKELSSKRRDIGLELLNSRLAATGNELLV